MLKTPQELLNERKKRVLDAADLKQPDRIPVYFPMGVFAAKISRLTVHEFFGVTHKWLAANEKVFRIYEPDFYLIPNNLDMVAYSELDYKQYRWPGHGVGENVSYQFVEGEYVKAEEYDDFLFDPGDFALRKYLPRVYGNLSGLGQMRPLLTLLRANELLDSVSHPEVLAALKRIVKAAEHYTEYSGAITSLGSKMEELGYPNILGRGSQPPFDYISDFFRGLKGGTLDLYRHPEKLMAAQEKILPAIVDASIKKLRITGMPLCFCALHRGADGFMSVKQFEKYYWPMLKRELLAFIEAGFKPFVFWEGSWDQRLEYLKELPKGRVVGWFDRTDLFRAKGIIGDTMCICGGMPISLLSTGTEQQVIEYARKLIDVVGKGGGYIMGSTVELDHAKPELVKTMVDFSREYGVYRNG